MNLKNEGFKLQIASSSLRNVSDKLVDIYCLSEGKSNSYELIRDLDDMMNYSKSISAMATSLKQDVEQIVWGCHAKHNERIRV